MIHKRVGERLSVPSMMNTYSPGGSVLNHTFLWRLPNDFSPEAALSTNQQVVTKLMEGLPVFHTRAMKGEFVSHHGLLMAGAKPYVLRYIGSLLMMQVALVHVRREILMLMSRKS